MGVLTDIKRDKEGYLLEPDQWTEQVAEAIAENDALKLSEDHWTVIKYIRNFYQEFNTSPSIRPLVKYLQQEWSKEKGNSIYLALLFPEGAAKQSTKIAGLPKPARCI